MCVCVMCMFYACMCVHIYLYVKKCTFELAVDFGYLPLLFSTLCF